MLPLDQSPLTRLVLAWWSKAERPSATEATGMRKLLFKAALDEMAAAEATGQPWFDPMVNPLFLWAAQYLQWLEYTRHHIDPETRMLASLILDPKPFLEHDFS